MIDRPSTSTLYAGLFGYASGAAISDLTLENAQVTGNNKYFNIYVGGLVGNNIGGRIENCSFSGNVTAKESNPYFVYLGGLVGQNSGVMVNCSSSGCVTNLNKTGSSSSSFYNYSLSTMGGLIGGNSGRLSDCTSSAKVTSSGGVCSVGGLVGYNAAALTGCRATGDVERSNDTTFDLYAGGLVGYNTAILTDCQATGNVTTSGAGHHNIYIGGLSGYNSAALINCLATGNVTGSGEYDLYTGGLVGYNSATLTNCQTTGNVTGNGMYYYSVYTGGLTGYCSNNSTGIISHCRTSGNVTGACKGSGFVYAGGLVGYNSAMTVTKCRATGNVGGRDTQAKVHCGGLVGYNRDIGTISICYFAGSVTACGTYPVYVGGLSGYNTGTISNCFSTGPLLVIDQSYPVSYPGSLVGYNGNTITNCYSYASAGALVRQLNNTLENSYWDVQNSGWGVPLAEMAKTTAEMKSQSTFTGWDFTDIWAIEEGKTYPYLRVFPAEFSLNVLNGNPEGGSVTVSPQAETYAPGTSVTLSITPNPGYVAVTPDGTTSLSPFTLPVSMDGQKVVNIQFLAYTGIRTLAELQAIGNNQSGVYVLLNDIDASDTANWNDAGTSPEILEGFKPICPDLSPFTGKFFGNGKKITGLTISRSSVPNVGLFGNISDATISDLSLVNADISSSFSSALRDSGILAGQSQYGEIRNCHVSGVINHNYCLNIGGLVGESSFGRILNCSSTATVKGTNQEKSGGLVGYCNSSFIMNCFAAGNVTNSRNNLSTYMGGLSGASMKSLTRDCYSTGLVENTTSSVYLGGMIGYDYNNSTTDYCYWDVQASGMDVSDGGTSKTTAEMKNRNTFEGWDFTGTWDINSSVNSGYPYLRSHVPVIDGIVVTLSPAAAVTAGAQWSIDNGTTWLNSGETTSGLLAGNYTVIFKPVPGWNTPAAQTVTLTSGGAVNVEASYGPQTGAVLVNISGTSSGQWRIADVVPWTAGGVQVNNLATGSYTVEFSDVAGLVKPASQTITVTADATTTVNGTYTPPAGIAWPDVLGQE